MERSAVTVASINTVHEALTRLGYAHAELLAKSFECLEHGRNREGALRSELQKYLRTSSQTWGRGLHSETLEEMRITASEHDRTSIKDDLMAQSYVLLTHTGWAEDGLTDHALAETILNVSQSERLHREVGAGLFSMETLNRINIECDGTIARLQRLGRLDTQDREEASKPSSAKTKRTPITEAQRERIKELKLNNIGLSLQAIADLASTSANPVSKSSVHRVLKDEGIHDLRKTRQGHARGGGEPIIDALGDSGQRAQVEAELRDAIEHDPESMGWVERYREGEEQVVAEIARKHGTDQGAVERAISRMERFGTTLNRLSPSEAKG
ncbi:MAG: hypothetical protein RLN76_06295 [Phycisphaeraceae bacterium]